MKARLQSFFDHLDDERIVQEHGYGDLPRIEDLATRLSQSFLVETRLALISQEDVEIQAVGTLKSESKNVFFNVNPQLIDDLQHPTFRLDDYLREVIGDTFSVCTCTPFGGLPLLTRIGAWLLEHLINIKKDPWLREFVNDRGEEGAKALLLKALELAIHDQICRGPAFEMDSIGIFVLSESHQTVDFIPDEHLLAGLAAAADRGQNQKEGKWGIGPPSAGETHREEGGTEESAWEEFLPEEKKIWSSIWTNLRAAVSRSGKA